MFRKEMNVYTPGRIKIMIKTVQTILTILKIILARLNTMKMRVWWMNLILPPTHQ